MHELVNFFEFVYLVTSCLHFGVKKLFILNSKTHGGILQLHIQALQSPTCGICQMSSINQEN